jgi:death-on-curing family protein
MSDHIPLTLEQAKFIASSFVNKFMQWGEPIPPFEQRYPGVLESCLESPFGGIGDIEFYPEVFDKASILFYLLCKDHPFQNGNKRMAVACTLIFLAMNGYTPIISNKNLYQFAIVIAQSNTTDKDIYIESIKEIISFICTRRNIADRMNQDELNS